VRYVSLATTVLLCLLPIERFVFLGNPLDIAVSNLARGIMMTGLTFCPLIVFAYWFKWKEVVSGKETSRVSYCLAGLTSLFSGTMYRFEVFHDGVLIGLALPLLVWLFLYGRSVMQTLVDLLPLRDADYRAMFPQFPPRERLDLIRLDLVLGFVLVLPVLGRWLLP
jgi:hypothetical protein